MQIVRCPKCRRYLGKEKMSGRAEWKCPNCGAYVIVEKREVEGKRDLTKED